MKNKFYLDCLNIRNFEEGLLGLFAKGLIKGTTHTCIGQENNAVGVCSALNKDDIVLSNHRCHGHFLSHTKNFEGLLNEILGKENGVCGGVGGSQHLFYKNIFYSNGILGGNLPMAVGLAKGIKLDKKNKIVCIFLGDGAFGEGVLYECLNMISLYKLPILLVVEENDIAQTTNTKETISGNIFDKCKSFKIDVQFLKYLNPEEIYFKTSKVIKKVRKNKPNILILKSTRLGPHSKGDDTRSKSEINNLKRKDPLMKLGLKLKKKDLKNIQKKSKKLIESIFENCLKEKNVAPNKNKKIIIKNYPNFDYLTDFRGRRFGELINHYFLKLAKNDKKIIFLGEDIVDPYGGAFKITKNIKNYFPNQIISTPISEASIVGMCGGLAIKGYRPIVEIMFGDFLSLAFDQILNNLSKFHAMYNQEVSLPLIIRTPMGGGRGYGPTHSQSIEKHFLGISGLNTFALNPFFSIDKIYKKAFESYSPSLVIENKLQYNFLISELKESKSYLSNFTKNESEKDLIVSFSLTNFKSDDCTIFCYGAASELALRSAYQLFIDEEISLRVVILSKLNELDNLNIQQYISANGTIFTLEESSKHYGFGSEVISILSEKNEFKDRNFLRISSLNQVIPSSMTKEKNVLVSTEKIIHQIKKKLNE